METDHDDHGVDPLDFDVDDAQDELGGDQSHVAQQVRIITPMFRYS